jgi:hypothetical protein
MPEGGLEDGAQGALQAVSIPACPSENEDVMAQELISGRSIAGEALLHNN